MHLGPIAHLHQPTEMKLVIRNRHPSKTAHVVVSIDLDNSDGFILSGVRSGRAPVLLPGAEHELVWNLIPLECGYVRLPRIRVVDRRKPFVSAGDQSTPSGHNPEADWPGEVVKVVDVRWDNRDGEGQESMLQRRNSLDSESSEEENGVPYIGTVLVVP
jgi:trafficking protein particle complex subunit 11